MSTEIGRRGMLTGIAGIAAASVVGRSAAWAEPAKGVLNRLHTVDQVKVDLVIANRVLADQGVVDAYGHVSRRHPAEPGRFFLSVSRSPELVEASDIREFRTDGTVAEPTDEGLYLERFIHAAIYRARPDVQAVAHAHADEVLPYTIVNEPIRPVIQNAGVLGPTIPTWDSREHFGDTDLLVRNMEMAADLAEVLGDNNVVLMRGHGFSAAAGSLIELLRMCIYLPQNARVQSEASRLGDIIPLTEGEMAHISDISPESSALTRAWEYWGAKAGCEALLPSGAYGL